MRSTTNLRDTPQLDNFWMYTDILTRNKHADSRVAVHIVVADC